MSARFQTLTGTAGAIAAIALTTLLAACATPPGRGPVELAPWPDAITVVAAGDIADCRHVPVFASGAARTAALIQARDTLVLTLGDNTYPVGAAVEFADCFEPTWGAFKDRIRPSPGNHDYQTKGADGYYAYFGTAAGPGRRGYYSFDLAGWHIVSLNSNVDARIGSAQHDWLRADLAAAAGSLCTLAYWHHPVFSSGPHGNDPRMSDALAALHAAGADVVLVGHDHVYERLAPHDATGAADQLRGIRTFTVGTGGARLYRFKTVHPASEFRDASMHGVLRLTLAAERYRWEFLPVDGGAPLDAGSASCHR